MFAFFLQAKDTSVFPWGNRQSRGGTVTSILGLGFTATKEMATSNGYITVKCLSQLKAANGDVIADDKTASKKFRFLNDRTTSSEFIISTIA